MVYKSIDELNIIITEQKEKMISAKKIIDSIKFLNYNVYFYCNGNLYGVVDTNKIKSINQDIAIEEISNCLSYKNFWYAKESFKENSKQEIPVIRDGNLLGAYVYGTSIFEVKAKYDIAKFEEIWDYYPKKMAVLSNNSVATNMFIERYFKKYGFVINYVSLNEMLYNEPDEELFVCCLESEIEVLYHIRAIVLENTFYFDKFNSLASIWWRYDDYKSRILSGDYICQYLRNLKNNNVDVFTLSFDTKNERYQSLYMEINHKYERNKMNICEKIIEPESFFGELYSESYCDSIINMPINMRNISGMNVLEDANSKYYNVNENIRNTVNFNYNGSKTIHLFGPCLIVGRYVEDKYTLASYIQEYANRDGENVKVINHGAWNNTYYQLKLMSESNIKSGDIVIIFDNNQHFEEIENIDLTEVLYNPNINAGWFVDNVYHANHIVNRMYSKKIYEEIKPYVKGTVKEISIKQANEGIIANIYLNKYFSEFKGDRYKSVGSIVMNANPFTRGHKYLVEEALKKVDFLIVFVVSEDKSFFSFSERFAIVKENLKSYENVMVVPSGDIIASNNTFPEYFFKIIDDNTEYNIRRDFELFAKYIAPELNITKRFVGTEPSDSLTNMYNKIMLEILPKNNIDVCVIKRRENAGGIVSASVVRNMIKENNYFQLKEYITVMTYRFLCEYIDIAQDYLYNKTYFAFVIDDCNPFTPKCYEVFHKNNVPLGVACISENLDKIYDNKSIKEYLHLVEEDGGEIFVHYYGNLADEGYFDGVHTFGTSIDEWENKTGNVKKILEDIGYNIRGIIRADYTQKNSKTGEKICDKYFEYSDNVGISGCYNLGDRKYFFEDDMKTIDQAKKYIDECCKKNGFYTFGLHGNNDSEPLAKYEILDEIIKYILQKGNTEITTYSKMYDEYLKYYY